MKRENKIWCWSTAIVLFCFGYLSLPFLGIMISVYWWIPFAIISGIGVFITFVIKVFDFIEDMFDDDGKPKENKRSK